MVNIKKVKEFMDTKRFCDLIILLVILMHYGAVFITQFMIFSATYDGLMDYSSEEEAERVRNDLAAYQVELEANPFAKTLFKSYQFNGLVMIELIFASVVVYYIVYLRRKLSFNELKHCVLIIFFLMMFDLVNDLGALFGAIYYNQVGLIKGLKMALQLNLTNVIGGLC